MYQIFGFRKRNWRFDIMGGALYFALVFSALPICALHTLLNATTWHELASEYIHILIQLHLSVFAHSYLSMIVIMGMWIGLNIWTEHWYVERCACACDEHVMACDEMC